MKTFHCESALLPEGWRNDVHIAVDDRGDIVSVTPESGASGAHQLKGATLAALPNLHSHAFQRALRGGAETKGPREDSFWTWREKMYALLETFSPEDVEREAEALYREMLSAGYGTVVEFHYLHRDPAGHAYDDPCELSQRILAAAKSAGIAITLLPVLYAQGGFDGRPLGPAQRRFRTSPDDILSMVETLRRDHHDDPQVTIGAAAHSLRAVSPEDLALLDDGLRAVDPHAPIHIHIAEQTKEVDECIATTGQRPVAWLLNHRPIDTRWCLVHATHIDGDECRGLAHSGAVAGLCPTTEANLGDGLFPAENFQSQGGLWGVGSDSQSSISVREELRWLEYGQRLFTRRRAVLSSKEHPSTGRALWENALRGGAIASGRKTGVISAHNRADFMTLSCEDAPLRGQHDDAILDAWLFGANRDPIDEVHVGGRLVFKKELQR